MTFSLILNNYDSNCDNSDVIWVGNVCSNLLQCGVHQRLHVGGVQIGCIVDDEFRDVSLTVD